MVNIIKGKSEGPYTVLVDRYMLFTWDIEHLKVVLQKWLEAGTAGSFFALDRNGKVLGKMYLTYPGIMNRIRSKILMFIVKNIMWKHHYITEMTYDNMLHYLEKKTKNEED